jgi:uncharacterized membrane protein
LNHGIIESQKCGPRDSQFNLIKFEGALDLACAAFPSIIPKARMICPHCSAEMPEISMFCPGCGRSVQGSDDAAPASERAANARDALLGAVSYIALLPAVLFLALPSLKASRFVRFHSWQSVFFSISTVILAGLMRGLFALFSVFPGVGFLFATLTVGLVFLAVIFLWLVLVIKAVQGEGYELPWLGRIAAGLAG